MRKKLIYGFAKNDSKEPCSKNILGKKITDPRYRTWINLLQRAFCEKYKAKFPTYENCTVCDEWLIYSNFKRWMDLQDWQGKQLDKDILLAGNKHYCPELCVFVSKELNYFLTANDAKRGDWPLGVNWHKDSGSFVAQCSDPFTKKRGYIGLFSCPEQAHLAWKKRKHEIACRLADEQKDERIAKALRERFA